MLEQAVNPMEIRTNCPIINNKMLENRNFPLFYPKSPNPVLQTIERIAAGVGHFSPDFE